MLNSSQFAARTNVTIRVMGGKSGKIAARNGKKRQQVARGAATTATLREVTAASVRLYPMLLAAYPRRFRCRFGGEMAQAFRDACREAYRRRGVLAVFQLWPRTLGDLVRSAAAERFDKLRRPGHGRRMRARRCRRRTFAIRPRSRHAIHSPIGTFIKRVRRLTRRLIRRVRGWPDDDGNGPFATGVREPRRPRPPFMPPRAAAVAPPVDFVG
jgi:hypothetical protein